MSFPTFGVGQELDVGSRDYLSGFGQEGSLSTFEPLDVPIPGKLSAPKDKPQRFVHDAAPGTRLGLLEFEPDGRVCVELADEPGRCDLFIGDGGLHFQITGDGSRFPIFLDLESR